MPWKKRRPTRLDLRSFSGWERRLGAEWRSAAGMQEIKNGNNRGTERGVRERQDNQPGNERQEAWETHSQQKDKDRRVGRERGRERGTRGRVREEAEVDGMRTSGHTVGTCLFGYDTISQIGMRSPLRATQKATNNTVPGIPDTCIRAPAHVYIYTSTPWTPVCTVYVPQGMG